MRRCRASRSTPGSTLSSADSRAASMSSMATSGATAQSTARRRATSIPECLRCRSTCIACSWTSRATTTSAYTSVFQDWRDWIVKGYLDFGVPMNYDSDWSAREKGWFGRWLGFEKDSGFANRVVIGVGAFLNYPEDTLTQIRRVLAASTGGNKVLGV